MKVASLASRILTALLAIAVIVLFFMGIVTAYGEQGTFTLAGYQMAFGTNVTSDAGNVVDMEVSAWYLFTFVFMAISAICACASFKWKKATIGGIATGAVSMIMMLVFSFSEITKYIDWRNITLWDIHFAGLAPVLTWCTIAFFVMSIVTLFVNDYAEVLESNGAKKTLVKRFVSFIREYVSEIKKISWPSFKTVLKNTLIVLIVCAIVGAFIWVLDFGLGNLIELLFGKA